jgi:hypothetical protein
MRRFALLLGVALSLISCSAVAQNCDGFVDLLASNPFCPDVTWMKSYGVTKGCDATHYCPTDNVSRLQMAAFMHRLGNDAFLEGGNAIGATAVLGTTDNNGLWVFVDNKRASMVQPAVDSVYGFNPNLVGGPYINSVAIGIAGATIAGGGGCNPGTGGSCTTVTWNQVNGNFGTVGGGASNSAGTNDTVAGGFRNTASGGQSTVAGGTSNTASNAYDTVAGGFVNTASGGSSTVAGGASNKASGGLSTVAGGSSNTASGSFSFAAGTNANADQTQCFVFANWSVTLSNDFSCLGVSNIAKFGLNHGLSVDYGAIQENGAGTRWVAIGDITAGQTISTWTTAYLSDAGVWTSVSDVNRKTGFESINPAQVLALVASMPITSWRYIGEDASKRHIGPMAQDFWAAFGLGDDDKHIGTIDEGGVALAAIKGLNAKIEEQQREIAELRERVQAAATLAADIIALKAALAELQRERESIAVK